MNRTTTGLRKNPKVVEHQWMWDQCGWKRIRACMACGYDGSYDIRDSEPDLPVCVPDQALIQAMRGNFQERP